MPGAVRAGQDRFGSGTVKKGSPDVIINGREAVRVGDLVEPHGKKQHGSPSPVVTGSSSVFANGRALAREGSRAACGDTAQTSSNNVELS